MNWLGWNKLCVGKESGGLGCRDFSDFNLAMLGKQGWKLLSDPDALICKVFKAIYYPRGDFLSAKLGHNPSYVWRSIWSSQVLLEKGIRWKVGDGRHIKVWADPWLRDSSNMKIESPCIPELSDLLVHDLMTPEHMEWGIALLHDLLTDRDVSQIISIPLGFSNHEDRLIWHFSTNGCYTVKSGYRIASTLSLNAAEQIQGDWNRLWALKLPPKVKMFFWRLGINCLPLKDNLQKRGILVPLVCEFYHIGVENSWHLFVSCHFAQDCWRNSLMHEMIKSCRQNAESFSELLFLLLAKLDDFEKANFCMILLSIWRQRNDKLWKNTNKNPATSVRVTREHLCDWFGAKNLAHAIETHNIQDDVCTKWHRPARSFVKCMRMCRFSQENKSLAWVVCCGMTNVYL